MLKILSHNEIKEGPAVYLLTSKESGKVFINYIGYTKNLSSRHKQSKKGSFNHHLLAWAALEKDGKLINHSEDSLRSWNVPEILLKPFLEYTMAKDIELLIIPCLSPEKAKQIESKMLVGHFISNSKFPKFNYKETSIEKVWWMDESYLHECRDFYQKVMTKINEKCFLSPLKTVI